MYIDTTVFFCGDYFVCSRYPTKKTTEVVYKNGGIIENVDRVTDLVSFTSYVSTT